jgi:hypothetical protein
MAGALVSTVRDGVATTGTDGHVFLKLDSGMTEAFVDRLRTVPSTPLRFCLDLVIPTMSAMRPEASPSLWPVTVVNQGISSPKARDEPRKIWKNESCGRPRLVTFSLLTAVGAYCSGMSAKDASIPPRSTGSPRGQEGGCTCQSANDNRWNKFIKMKSMCPQEFSKGKHCYN